MKIIAATCVVTTALCTVVYHLFNTAGAPIRFDDTSAHEALIAHVYVLTSGQNSTEARTRKAAFQTYLKGVPHTEVHPDSRHLRNCRGSMISLRHQQCTAGHMAILDRIVANTSSPPGSFSVIFEDDMCPSQLVGTGATMLRNIARALASSSKGVMAVNIGACNGKGNVERARAKFISADCHVLGGFGPCTHAWATTRARAPKLLRTLRTNICKRPIDIILSRDSARRRYEHIACKGTFPVNGAGASPASKGRLFHQCFGSSIINPV
jgi:hypothetical protein